MLFTIFEDDLTIYKVKAKEEINLTDAIIDYDAQQANPLVSDQNKHKFRILTPFGLKPIENGGKYYEHVIGCSNEDLRNEWVLNL